MSKGYVPHTILLNTVYECLTGRFFKIEQSQGTSPSIEVNGAGASINIYISNSATKPTDKTEMTLDDESPFAEGAYRLRGQIKWILFEDIAGTPTINTLNVVKVE